MYEQEGCISSTDLETSQHLLSCRASAVPKICSSEVRDEVLALLEDFLVPQKRKVRLWEGG